MATSGSSLLASIAQSSNDLFDSRLAIREKRWTMRRRWVRWEADLESLPPPIKVMAMSLWLGSLIIVDSTQFALLHRFTYLNLIFISRSAAEFLWKSPDKIFSINKSRKEIFIFVLMKTCKRTSRFSKLIKSYDDTKDATWSSTTFLILPSSSGVTLPVEISCKRAVWVVRCSRNSASHLVIWSTGIESSLHTRS